VIVDGKASAGTPNAPWKRNWFATAFVLALLGLLVFGAINSTLHPPAPETSEQLRARQKQEGAMQDARRQADENRAAERIRTRGLCKAKAGCTRYAEARQACATAGNFDTCMNIKTENYSTARYDCTNDGKLTSAPGDLPNEVECIFSFVP
jgi:hypothetical protein